jgi:hypothetical protein
MCRPSSGSPGTAFSRGTETRRQKDQAPRSWGQHWGHLAGRVSQLFININHLQGLFGSALRDGCIDLAYGFRVGCLNAESRRSTGCYKKLNSAAADSENNLGGSSETICTTSDSTFTRKRSAIA